MRVYGVQFDMAWEDKAANCRRVERMLSAAAPAPGSLIVLPEMFATGFSMAAATIAEPPGGATEEFLGGLARRYRAYVVGGVAVHCDDGRPFNQAVAFGPDGVERARYSKIHPFSLCDEHLHFAAGKQVAAFACGEFVATPFVCYDLRFPELFRAALRHNATLFLVIANWPEPRVGHWTALLRARAIENQAYVVGVNRCGRDPQSVYSGHSIVIGPQGETLAEAGAEEEIVQAELDYPSVEAYRMRFPALRDMGALPEG